MGSVAGGSGAHEPTIAAATMHATRTRPIMRAVPPIASLRDTTVIIDDRRILSAVNVEVGPGLTLVRGPNGAGKTTLLRALAGLVPITLGHRQVSGEMLFLGQRPMLLRGLTPRENLSFYSRFRGRAGDVDAALVAWGVPAAEFDRPVERLSAGERRRASLARLDTEALPIVLLDEPFTELDEDAAAKVRTAITRLVAAGRSAVVATHGHAELDASADATIVLDRGARVS